MTFNKIEKSFKKRERELRKSYRTYQEMAQDDLWHGRYGAMRRHLNLAEKAANDYKKFIDDLTNV